MVDNPSLQNDRSLERHFIMGDIDVYDGLRDLYIGRLVNIHAQGLMIVGELLLEEDNLYEIDIHLPEWNSAPGSVLRLGVDCLWTRSADQDDKHWMGFSIIDASPHVAEEIRHLVEHWAQH
jgi:hypothetical protein